MSEITVSYVKDKDIINGTLKILEKSLLESIITCKDIQISLKPNGVRTMLPSEGSTTHTEIIEGVIIFLQQRGVFNIEIIESAWVGDDTECVYEMLGYYKIAKKYGVKIFDLKRDKACKVKCGEFEFNICEKVLKTDFLINIPVLKIHPQTTMTCCLKNLKGCIPDSEKRRFHAIGLNAPIAWLNKAIRADFCIVDAICGDLTFEGSNNIVTRNMLICGTDPLLLDTYCAEILGYSIDDIEHLNIAAKIGVGKIYSKNTKVHEINSKNKPKFSGKAINLVKKLGDYVEEQSACSACYSSLIYALNKSGIIPESKISIGQGFRGKSGDIGCGNCTKLFEKYVPGCPPKVVDIVELLSITG